MPEWKLSTLGSVATISSGSTPPTAEGPFDVMGANGRIGSAPKSNFGPGYLVGRVGAAGAITRVASPCWASDNTLTVVPNAAINEALLGHILQRLDLERVATKTAQPLVTQSELRKLRITLPPLEEQRQIAEILDTIDETINATKHIIAKLVVVARAIQDRLVSSASGRSVTLGSIAILSGGHGFPKDEQGSLSGPIAFYKVSDMNSPGNEKFLDKANNYVQPETAERHGWRVLPPGAVAFAKVGAALLSNRRRILKASSIIDNNMMAAIPSEVVSTEWLYRWLQTIDFAKLVQVGALPSVNQGLVGGLTLDLPTLCEQERQTDVLETYDSRVNTELAQLAKYKKVRAGLAADLLSGRVRTVAS